jgi:hypothetical protein
VHPACGEYIFVISFIVTVHYYRSLFAAHIFVSSRKTVQEALHKPLPAYCRGLSDTYHQLVRAPWTDGMSAAENTTQEAPAAPTAEGSRPAVTTDDNLACQWEKCSDRCASAEALFVSLLSILVYITER